MASTSACGSQTKASRNRPASVPIFQSSGWEFASLDEADGVFSGRLAGAAYGNCGTPNHDALETILARLERTEAALLTPGAMAAIAAVLFGVLKPGDHLVAARDCYGATAALLGDLERWHVRVTRVETTDIEAVGVAMRAPTRMLLTETISNPTLRVPDLSQLAHIAELSGALLVVDNTFATPFHCRPADWGADLVVESVTKALSGHHDVIVGAIAGPSSLLDSIRTFSYRTGARPGAFDAWLAARGVSSFCTRQARCSATAARVAAWLQETNDFMVNYPGLPRHCDHSTAAKFFEQGYGSTISFDIGGNRAAAVQFADSLQHIGLVHSAGGTRTTISHPLTMSHRGLTATEQEARGLSEGFFRLSIGLEDLEDIVSDLESALAASCEA